jgi:hypothetical protein
MYESFPIYVHVHTCIINSRNITESDGEEYYGAKIFASAAKVGRDDNFYMPILPVALVARSTACTYASLKRKTEHFKIITELK